MSKTSELFYDIEQMYIDGLSAQSISRILNCSMDTVLAVLEDIGVTDAKEDNFDPFNTVNS